MTSRRIEYGSRSSGAGVSTRFWLGAASLLALSACLSPAEQRARADEMVGQADAPSMNVRVVEGLAAVRQFDAERLSLWQSAPSIQFDLQSEESGALELVIDNCMAGSVVEQIEGEPAELDVLPSERVTQLRSRLVANTSGRRVFEVRPPRTSGPFHIALLSDVQRAIDRFGDIVTKLNEQPDLDFLLGAGDLTQGGTHEQLQRFVAELQPLNVPYYTTLGNHELGVSPSLFQTYFGRGSLHFEHRGVHFTLLDSASATIDPMVYEWIDDWGRRGRDALHVVAMHIPPIDPVGVRNGSFASREEAAKLLGRLKGHDVDLTLYGHIHSYYRFDNGGIPARISGGGGAIPERFDTIGRHFLVIDLQPDEQRFETHVVRVDPGD